MPTRKHAAHRDTDAQGAANATPSAQAAGATDPVAQAQTEAATDPVAQAQAAGATDTTTTTQPQAQGQAQGATPAASLDDIQVPWRKETATGSTEATAGAEATTATEETVAVDWEARFKAEQAKADDYFAKWQRAAADLANMRRRHEQERQEYMKQANAMLIAELLPVLDSFDRALASMPPDLRELTWIDGIVLVERQLRMVLERAGLTPIEAEGKPFNPTEHEALLHEESDKPEDTVISELQKGYKLHERVLRPALVKVAKK
jgi:molecular chaperone GrpE